jgi:hypothetical protein
MEIVKHTPSTSFEVEMYEVIIRQAWSPVSQSHNIYLAYRGEGVWRITWVKRPAVFSLPTTLDDPSVEGETWLAENLDGREGARLKVMWSVSQGGLVPFAQENWAPLLPVVPAWLEATKEGTR